MKAKKLGRKTSLQGIFYYTFSRWRCCALETSTGLIICLLAWRAWYGGEGNVIRAFYCASNISFRATVCLHLCLLCSICLQPLGIQTDKTDGKWMSLWVGLLFELLSFVELLEWFHLITALQPLEGWRRILQFKIPNAIRLGMSYNYFRIWMANGNICFDAASLPKCLFAVSNGINFSVWILKSNTVNKSSHSECPESEAYAVYVCNRSDYLDFIARGFLILPDFFMILGRGKILPYAICASGKSKLKGQVSVRISFPSL